MGEYLKAKSELEKLISDGPTPDPNRIQNYPDTRTGAGPGMPWW